MMNSSIWSSYLSKMGLSMLFVVVSRSPFTARAGLPKISILLVPEDDLPEIEQLVATQGYTLASGKIPFAVGKPEFREIYRISKIAGQDVFSLDLIIVTPILTDVWEDREIFEWQGRNVQVVFVDGLAKMKKLAGRDQDFLDPKKSGVLEDDSEEGE